MKKLISLILFCSFMLLGNTAYAVPSRSTGDLDAADETVSIPVNDCGGATIQLTGTWSGTVTFEATTLGSTWVAVPAKNANTGADATTATANGIYVIAAGGYNRIRARFSTATSGTVTATAQCGEGPNVISLSSTGLTLTTTPGYEKTDDAAFTPGTSKVAVIGGTFDDTAPDSVDEGDVGAPRISANRNLYTTIRDAAGNERGANVDASNQLSVVDSAVKTAVELIDNAVSGAGFNITQLGGAAVPIGAGVEATAVRVTLPTDGTGLVGTELTTSDLDTGAGTDTKATVGLSLAKSGGSALVGAGADGDPVPVSDDGGSLTIDNADVTTTATNTTNIASDTDSLAVVGNGAAATAQRVTLANDSTGIVALTTSSATIGKLAANSGVDIGDVDVTSAVITTFPDNEPINIAQVGGNTVSAGSGINGTGVQRFTLATDDELNDDADSIRIAAEIIDDWDESDRAKVNPIVGQAGVAAGSGTNGVTVQRVTVATDDEINDDLDTIAGDTTNIETAIQIIDDWDNATSDGASVTGATAHDAAALEDEPVTIGGEAVETDGTAAPNAVSAEGDTVRQIYDRYGRAQVSLQHPNSWCATEAETGAVTNDAIKAAPGANLSLYVCSFVVSNGATAGDYKLVEDTAGTPVTIVEKIYTAINGGAVVPLSPCLRVTANKDIGVTSTSATTGSYTVCGYTAP